MITISNLSAGYARAVVLSNISFSVAEGEFVTVLGPNGSGKSTLLKAMAGVLPAKTGTILVDDRDVTSHKGAARVRDGITLIPQGRRMFGSLTVQQNLEMGAYTVGSGRPVREAMSKWMDVFPELDLKRRSRASELSGGQQQLVAIVRGLMSNPSILLLDEPSLGVSPNILGRVGSILKTINKEMGLGIVLVEQNVEFALSLAERILLLRSGQIVLDTRVEELDSRQTLYDAYFEKAATDGPTDNVAEMALEP